MVLLSYSPIIKIYSFFYKLAFPQHFSILSSISVLCFRTTVSANPDDIAKIAKHPAHAPYFKSDFSGIRPALLFGNRRERAMDEASIKRITARDVTAEISKSPEASILAPMNMRMKVMP